MKTTSVMIVGVGGQGSLLASKLLGRLLTDERFDVKVSEVHGMSQRGGSVVTYVRFGDKVYSPIVTDGEADIIIAFERLEAARVKHYLKKDGILLVNDEKILPMPCITGAAVYPDDVKETLLSAVEKTHFINAQAWAMEAGSGKATNIVMMGALCRLLGFDKEIMKQAVAECVPAKFATLNLNAFELGYERV